MYTTKLGLRWHVSPRLAAAELGSWQVLGRNGASEGWAESADGSHGPSVKICEKTKKAKEVRVFKKKSVIS